ncbi:MAG: hypothetical protein ABF826_08140 [Komagataeibacter saccharivorans]
MTGFAAGVMTGAGGMVVLIGLLVIVPIRVHACLMAARLRARGLE